MWHIPSLKAVYILPASALSPFARETYLSTGHYPVIASPQKLPSVRRASLASEEQSSGIGGKSTLTFTTDTPIPLDGPLAFIAETHIQGLRYLVGAFEPPFPLIKIEATTGSRPSDTAAATVTVTWPFPPIPTLVLL